MNRLKTLLAATLLGLGAAAAVPFAAQADSYYFSRGGDHGDRWSHRSERHGDWRRDRHSDWRRGRSDCSARDAIRKARAMGLDRARVARMGRRTVTVAGQRWHRPVMVQFARERGCPTIG